MQEDYNASMVYIHTVNWMHTVLGFTPSYTVVGSLWIMMSLKKACMKQTRILTFAHRFRKNVSHLLWPLSRSFFLLCLAKGDIFPVPLSVGTFVPSHFYHHVVFLLNLIFCVQSLLLISTLHIWSKINITYRRFSRRCRISLNYSFTQSNKWDSLTKLLSFYLQDF